MNSWNFFLILNKLIFFSVKNIFTQSSLIYSTSCQASGNIRPWGKMAPHFSASNNEVEKKYNKKPHSERSIMNVHVVTNGFLHTTVKRFFYLIYFARTLKFPVNEYKKRKNKHSFYHKKVNNINKFHIFLEFFMKTRTNINLKYLELKLKQF